MACKDEQPLQQESMRPEANMSYYVGYEYYITNQANRSDTDEDGSNRAGHQYCDETINVVFITLIIMIDWRM